MQSNQPWLSVIIPLCEPDPDAAECLRSLAACGEPGMEVIMAGRISAEHRTLANDYPLRLHLISQPDMGLTGGAGALRNLGAAQARGEILFFTAPGCRVPPNLPARLNAQFADPDLSALGGGVRPLDPGQPLALISALEMAFEQGDPEEDQAPCPSMACAAFRAADFRAAGMCNELIKDVQSSDKDLCQRIASAGGLVAHDDELWVREDLPRTWGQVWQAQTRRGQSWHQELRSGLRLHGAAYLQPALLILATLLLAVYAPQDPGRGITLALICLLLLYPANRGFLRYVGLEEPGMLRTAFWFCLLRPIAWLWGMLRAALGRLGMASK